MVKSKLILILIYLGLSYSYSIYSQEKAGPYSKTVHFSSKDNGFKGQVRIKFGFVTCFDDIVAPIGWDNLNIEAVKYNGKAYAAADLDLYNFDDYVLGVSKIEATFFIKNAPAYSIGWGYSNYVPSNWGMGCYGETIKVSKKNDYQEKINSIDARFHVVIGMNGSLSSKIKKLEKITNNKEIYDELMYDYEYARSSEEKFETLRKARKYTDDYSEINRLEKHLNNEIKRGKVEQFEKLEKERQKKLDAEFKKNSVAQKVKIETEKGEQKKGKQEKWKPQRQDTRKSNNEALSKVHNSYNKGMDKVKSMRDEANSMVVQYRYQLDYKNKLIKQANELENNLVKPKQHIHSGTDEKKTSYNSSVSSIYSGSKDANLQRKVAIAQASVHVLSEILKVDPVRQKERQENRYKNYLRRRRYNRELKEIKKSLFKEELMSDYSKNGLAVKKNKQGEWIIKPKYLDAKEFVDGKALVTNRIGNKFYINSKGKKL